MRIVSLLPSATEIICAIGLEKDLVGVTHECDYPPSVRDLPRATRTLIPTAASSATIDGLVRDQLAGRLALYSLDLGAIEQLEPQLIVSQTLCDVCAVADTEVRAAAARLRHAPQVLYLEPTRFRDVFESFVDVGAAAGIAAEAKRVVQRFAERIERVRENVHRISRGRRPRVLILEWLDPPFSSGHWTPELVEIAGGTEIIARAGERSRRITIEQIADADPDVLVIACCGFSVERTMLDVPAFLGKTRIAGLRCVRERRAFVIDGSAYFSRPGPRLVDSVEILAHAIWAGESPLPPEVPAATPIIQETH